MNGNTHTHKKKKKKPQIAKAILRKKNGTGGISLSGSRLHYKAAVIKTEWTVWYWHKDINIYVWNKVETHRQKRAPTVTLSFRKTAKICNEEKTISLTSGSGKTGQPGVKE